MGTNWFMPALVNNSPGESGSSEADGTIVWPVLGEEIEEGLADLGGGHWKLGMTSKRHAEGAAKLFPVWREVKRSRSGQRVARRGEQRRSKIPRAPSVRDRLPI